MNRARDNHRFCGREFAPQDVSLIQEVVKSCPGISRTELSYTVSELLEWRRPNGGLKGRECLNFLERLESEGYFRLPESHGNGPRKGTRRHIAPAKDSPAWGRTVWECRGVFAPGYGNWSKARNSADFSKALSAVTTILDMPCPLERSFNIWYT